MVRQPSVSKEEPGGVRSPVHAAVPLDGESWQGLCAVWQSPPEVLGLMGRKGKVPTMAANKFHSIEIRTGDPAPNPNLSPLSPLLQPLNDATTHPAAQTQHLRLLF